MNKVLLSMLLVVLSASAPAEDLWLQGGFFSHHIPDAQGMREVNPGIGMQYDVSKSVSIIGGQYLNSVNAKSNYYGSFVGYRAGMVKAGASIICINGYKLMNNGNEFYGVVPTLSVEGSRLGFNLVYIPPIEGVVGVIAIQFKMKIN